MKVVVADTSPLNYLILIGAVEVLPGLFGEILVPDSVVNELRDRRTPEAVQRWTSQMPDWIRIHSTPARSESLDNLDAGERAAILLAVTFPESVLLLMDDAEGRAEARRRHIPTTGTLGVLRAAAIRKLIDLPTALLRLRATNFRCSTRLLDEMLAEAEALRLSQHEG